MAGRAGNYRAEHGRIEHQHGAGDAGHAGRHHHEQFAARQLAEIGPDAKRRLDHAEEDIGGGGQPDRAADAKEALQHNAKAAHDRRQDAPIERERGEHAHHQHHRQGLQGEDEIGAWRLQFERQGSAAEIAENEGGAGTRRRRDTVDGVADHRKAGLELRNLEKQQGEHEGQGDPGRDLPKRHGAAVLAHCKGERQENKHADGRLEALHGGAGLAGESGKPPSVPGLTYGRHADAPPGGFRARQQRMGGLHVGEP